MVHSASSVIEVILARKSSGHAVYQSQDTNTAAPATIVIRMSLLIEVSSAARQSQRVSFLTPIFLMPREIKTALMKMNPVSQT
jgi:hypothetical protein